MYKENKPQLKQKLVIILGPTACGKTELSLFLAHSLDGEIISGDSMQVYRGMDIGTAKIRPYEMVGIPHHLIDIRDPHEGYSVADFQQMAKELIEKINLRGRIPIIVGGTGLYINSLIDPYYFLSETAADPDFRAAMLDELKQIGNEAMHERLMAIDPDAALKIHPNDSRRIIRALEVYHQTGLTFSQINQEGQKNLPPDYQLSMIGLTMDRQDIYDRINARVEIMVEDGLVEEVRGLLDAGYSKEEYVMQGLGYRQIIPYLEGEISLEEAIENLKRDTRHFAKRQLTWFKRDQRINWFNRSHYPGQEELAKAVISGVRQDLKED